MNRLKIVVLGCVLAVQFFRCLGDENVKSEYLGYQPVQGNDGWVISSPENEDMDATLVESAFRLVYDEERFIMAKSLLVLRNGQLVAEAYPHDEADRGQIQNIQSCTKSYTSILTGIAFSKGLLDSLTQPLASILPEEFGRHPDKGDITIQDALTMRTGIAFNNDDHTQDLYSTSGNSVDYILGLEKKYPAGTVFHYNDGAPHLISAAIQQRYQQSLASFAAEYLFKPLQITEWKWEAAKDGRSFGAMSLYLKPRDLAKFGQLLLNNGQWNGTQVVDSSWIVTATQPLVTTESPGASYGYYFWVYPAYPAYAAVGHGGQFILVAPLPHLVIIYTAWPYTSGELFDNFFELADLIIRSCH
jgi:CubicO group peptidase (beta-lactamase class C family)